MSNNDAGIATEASVFSDDWYRSTDYNFNPDDSLAGADTPDGKLIALESEINRFEEAHMYLTRRRNEPLIDDPSDKEFDDQMCGLTAAQGEMMDAMRNIRATTDAGRQAKARVVFSRAAPPTLYSVVDRGEFGETRLLELVADLCGMSPLALVHCRP
jgi:hypothetical protein